MVKHRVHIGRKDGLGVVVDRHGRVGSTTKGLGQRTAVVQLALDLDVGLVGVEGEGYLALGAVHLVHLAALHRLGAVGILQHLPVGGGKGGGAMVLGPVELDAAADPGPSRPTSAGLITWL